MRFSKVGAIRVPNGSVNELRHNGKRLWNHIRARYVSLGDSIAAGHTINDRWETDYGYKSQYGENGNAETVIVPESYTDVIHTDLMQKYNGTVNATSFAHSGDTVADLMAKLDHTVVRNAIEKADYVTVCIGANDVLEPAMSHFEEYVSTGSLASAEAEIENNFTALATDSNANSYTALFNKLYSINPNAKYAFMTVYNPYKYLWLDESTDGFFRPLLNLIPNMDINVDEAVEDEFGFDDLGYYDVLKFEWVSISLDFDVDQAIKEGLLLTPVVRQLFDRVNGLCDWSERYVTRLNTLLKDKLSAFGKENFKVADTKAVFDTYPDRPVPADVHYNDLVNVEFTRGYEVSEMDWGALWRDSNAANFWWMLAKKHIHLKFPGWDNLSWNVNDYVDFRLDDLAIDLVTQIVEKVILPDVDPHPEQGGHYVLKGTFVSALGI